jgi:hypothetical protein
MFGDVVRADLSSDCRNGYRRDTVVVGVTGRDRIDTPK